MRNVLLADNQQITALGLRSLLAETPEVNKIFTVNNKSDLIGMLSDNPEALVIIDYTVFDFNTVNELFILSERYDNVSWLLFSEELSDSFLREIAVNNLSFSIIFKTSTLQEIKNAMNLTIKYEMYRSENIQNHMRILMKSYEQSDNTDLTVTEKEVLKEIALGKTTKEVAAQRNLSIHTVMTHRKNIFRKLRVNTIHEATKYAMRAGIVDSSEYYI